MFQNLEVSIDSNCSIAKSLIYVVLVVGIVKVVKVSLSFLSILVNLYVLPPVNFSKYGAKKGTWAVVTGASDGIGKEYSLQLAKKGFNILLVSRTKSKLEVLGKEIETKYKVETKVLAFDAATDASENYASLQAEISTLPVTILVNNVGQSHSIPVPFLETEEKEFRDIVTINNVATLKITQIVAPVIVKTAKELKKKGLIMTMGSFGALLPTPYLATYSGSKAFLQNWSNALAGELKSSNVDVELVISYLVTSAMSKIKRSSFSIPNPKNFVASTLRNVGRARVGAQERYATITPYPAHALMHFFIEQTVGVYSSLANKLNLNMHKSIRARALKKAQRLSEAAAKQD